MTETRYFRIPPRGAVERLPATAEPVVAPGEGYLWLDFYNPTAEDLRVLVDKLGVHPLSVEDCLDEDQVPKVDDLPGYTFILFNSFAYADHKLVVEEIDLLLGKGFLATVHRNGEGRRLVSRRLDDAIQLDLANVRKGPDFLLHVLLDYVVDEKFVAIEALQEELDAAEETILREPGAFHPEALLSVRKNLLVMRKSLFHEREILVRICRRDSPFVSDKAIYHFRDIYDHLSRFFETTEILREMVSTHMEMYLSLVNHRMTLLTNQTNQVMRRLTFITTIFMPLTLLAGIGGMSEWTMMTGAEHWRVAYPLFFGGMVLVGAGNAWLLRHIERRRGEARRGSGPR